MTQPIADDFLIGCADAAHQVEGGLRNNWTEFEEQFPEKILDNSRSGIACDQYHRYHEDIQLLASIGANAYRFSLEWSRIEPTEGNYDQQALKHYRDVIHTCRKYGIEPIVTLQHFTLPIWIQDKGGIQETAIVYKFARYVAVCVAALGDIVTWWITVNEPNVLGVMSYMWGYWPPSERSLSATFRAFRTLMRMHAAAYCAIKDGAAREQRRSYISFAHHERPFFPKNPLSPIDKAVATTGNALVNAWELKAATTGKLARPIGSSQRVHGLAHSMDYLGLNYYTGDVATLGRHGVVTEPMPGMTVTDALSSINPVLFEETIIRLWQTWHLPILITENGVSDTEDSLRPEFLEDHLAVVLRVKNAGIPILGYLHWSLMDNFEWSAGYTQHFGLYSVDRTTLERIPKASVSVFQKYSRILSESAGQRKVDIHTTEVTPGSS